MLFAYQQMTQRFIRDAKQELVNPDDLVTFINEARGQLAGEADCIVHVGTLALTSPTQVYPFSAIALGVTGIAGPLKVRTLWYGVASGQLWIRPRPWPWFSLYELSNPVPSQGPPKVWAQYGQGASGTIYVSPLPDTGYSVQADCICYPSPLALDTDPEVIPYQWTDAIPYYAAYLAMLSMETPAALQEADKMFGRYQEYVARARRAATSPVMPGIYAQSPNVTRAGQLGMSAPARGAQ